MLGASDVHFGSIAMGLLGGLAIFLFGIEQMTDALKTVAGRGMKRILKRLTGNRFKAVLAGGFVTAVIQSSSVTTVLTVGFVSAGLMSLEQSIGIIMGAGIGTTITAQIIAFKITKFALLIVSMGFAIKFFAKGEKSRNYGTMLFGFGLIFFGMSIMKTTMTPLQDYEPFMRTMQSLDNRFLAILFGALFTGLVQSSSATTAVIIAMAGEGLVRVDTGVCLAFGANIGTCVTALLASIGRPRVALRTAMIHVSFNVLGVVLWFNFVDPLVDFVTSVAKSPERQIAHAHTLFNVGNTLVFIGFVGAFSRLVYFLIPERPEEVVKVVKPKYLDGILIETPELALDRVRLELGHVGKYASGMVRRALPAAATGTRADLEALAKLDDDVDILHGAIVTYLGRLSQANLTEAQTEQLADFMAIANHIESIGDMVETNIVHIGLERVQQDVHMSEETQKVLGALHSKVCWSVDTARESVVEMSPTLAREVTDAKTEITRLADEADRHLGRRLTAPADHRVALFQLESEIIEYLKRVYYFAKRIAKAVAEVEMAFLQEEEEES